MKLYLTKILFLVSLITKEYTWLIPTFTNFMQHQRAFGIFKLQQNGVPLLQYICVSVCVCICACVYKSMSVLGGEFASALLILYI